MNRKFAVVVTTFALGSIVLSGCTDGRATSDNASPSSIVSAPATAKAPNADELKAAPPVIHPNVLLNIRCTEDGTIESYSVDINGASGKQNLPLSVNTATPKFDTGWDCYFHLSSHLTSATYVTAIPMRPAKARELKTAWFFSEALTATGLNWNYGKVATVGLVKGQESHVYVEVNGLPKPDSFNSTILLGGSLNAQQKDYNRRVDEMNELTLTKLAGVTYPTYAD